MAGAEFSRFEINFDQQAALPIFPLQYPDEEGAGAVLVGDYVANDFVDYHTRRDPNFHDRWMVVSTTQSDAIPTGVDRVDLNLFSNASGIQRYLEGQAGRVPYSVDIADGLFVDPNIFHPPDTEQDPLYDILYLAKWYHTKKTELLIEVAEDRPDIRVGIYGWLMASERKRAESEAYREHIMGATALLPNVQIFDASEFKAQESHTNPDGSVVLGPLSKDLVRDSFIHRSRTGIYLSENTEAVNRASIETLLCDRPVIVALPTQGGMERFMAEGATSVFCERSAAGIAEAYDQVVDNYDSFSPRETVLTFAGRDKANQALRELVGNVADRRGLAQSRQPWNTYGGDLWTAYDTYATIL